VCVFTLRVWKIAKPGCPVECSLDHDMIGPVVQLYNWNMTYESFYSYFFLGIIFFGEGYTCSSVRNVKDILRSIEMVICIWIR